MPGTSVPQSLQVCLTHAYSRCVHGGCCSCGLPCPCLCMCYMGVSASRSQARSTSVAPGKRQCRLTLPRSRMKQSPLLKLSQDTGTSVARTTRRPLTWKSLCTTTSLGTTCLNPDATPPFCWVKQIASVSGRGSKEADMGAKNRVELKEILAGDQWPSSRFPTTIPCRPFESYTPLTRTQGHFPESKAANTSFSKPAFPKGCSKEP